MFSLPHLILTGLHMLQMTLAYFLMLIVMTYNSWLCGAVILGSTLGYFCFGWRKTSIVDVSESQPTTASTGHSGSTFPEPDNTLILDTPVLHSTFV